MTPHASDISAAQKEVSKLGQPIEQLTLAELMQKLLQHLDYTGMKEVDIFFLAYGDQDMAKSAYRKTLDYTRTQSVDDSCVRGFIIARLQRIERRQVERLLPELADR